MTLTEILTQMINSEYGWSVAGQFEDTFNGSERFEDQNENAMKYINSMLKDILDADDSPFNNSAKQQIFTYQQELQEYLEGKMADGGMMAKGGLFDSPQKRSANRGRSWTLDHRQHNKGESYETPLNKRKRKY